MTVQLNLAAIHMGKETVFGDETGSYVAPPGLIEKGDVTPKFPNKEIPIGCISSRNEAEVVLHGSSDNSIKMKMRLQNGRPFHWLMGGYAVVAGIQIDATTNTITFDLVGKTITRASGSWIDDGLEVTDSITIAGSASNNSTFTITVLTATVITVSESIADESMTTGTLLVSPPFSHAITNANTVNSYSIEHVINEDYSHKFLGCKCDELVFTMSKDQPVICEATFKAQNHDFDDTPGTPPACSTDIPYEFYQITTMLIDGTSYLTYVRQVKITMGNGLEGDPILSSLDPGHITEGRRKCMWAVEIWEQDETLLKLQKDKTEFAISLVITRGIADTITFTCAKAKCFDPSQDYGGNAVADILPIRIIGDWTVTFSDNETTYDI